MQIQLEQTQGCILKILIFLRDALNKMGNNFCASIMDGSWIGQNEIYEKNCWARPAFGATVFGVWGS